MATDAPRFTRADAQLPTCPCCHDVHERDEYAERHADGLLRLVCPGCGREFRPTDRLSVFYELYDCLAMHRGGVHIDEMAMVLLRSEQGTRELVGLSEKAEQAVFLNTESRTLVAVGFDAHGVCVAVDETLVRRIRTAESWLSVNEQVLCWTHPRYDS